MALREIPEQNLVHIPVPDAGAKSPGSISHSDFTRFIWEPARRAIEKRGIGDHILAWAYSTDFPISVSVHGGMSIQGVTFLRNRLPSAEQVKKGSYESPFFSAPSRPRGVGHYPQSFDVYKRWLGRDMPLPSMMLGYTGERGNTEEEVIQMLERGRKADNTRPNGTIYFVTSADIRSKCRQWQFPGAVRELTGLGVQARITGDFPAGATNVLGVMVGAANVKPRAVRHYLPGAMGEHLTSAAAVFSGASQTKLSAWLRAGASGSAGTVTEPLSIWTKFPSAHFFVYYVSGCTMIESFFQSIRCPLQVLLVGDPLAAPWKPGPGLLVTGLDAGEDVTALELSATVRDERAYYGEFMYLLDGKTVGRKAGLRLSGAEMGDGDHTLRIVAYGAGLVRPQVFLRKSLSVKNNRIRVKGGQ